LAKSKAELMEALEKMPRGAQGHRRRERSASAAKLESRIRRPHGVYAAAHRVLRGPVLSHIIHHRVN